MIQLIMQKSPTNTNIGKKSASVETVFCRDGLLATAEPTKLEPILSIKSIIQIISPFSSSKIEINFKLN